MRVSLQEKIDPKILESSLGGDDNRTFDSSTYLQGDFTRDFADIINGKEENNHCIEKSVE